MSERRSEKGEFEGQAPSSIPSHHSSFQTTSEVRLTINGHEVRVPTGTIVAAAVSIAGVHRYRRSVTGEARAPLCGMGICFECRATIDGRPHRLSCQTVCAEGMRVITE
jgi:D-hydroxyproline dehydrogenase subunit gamma